MNIKGNKNCKITINDEEISVSEKEKTANKNKRVFDDETNDTISILGYQERIIKEIVKKDDEYTKQVIKDYFRKKYPKENLKFDFLDEEIVDKIIKLGIAEYQRRQALGGVLSERK